MKYRISYRYVNPGPGGPFRGQDVFDMPTKPVKGETIWAMFGMAAIVSASRVKEPALTPVQLDSGKVYWAPM